MGGAPIKARDWVPPRGGAPRAESACNTELAIPARVGQCPVKVEEHHPVPHGTIMAGPVLSPGELNAFSGPALATAYFGPVEHWRGPML